MGTTDVGRRPLSVRGASELLGCSRHKLEELLRDGRLPGARRLDASKRRSPWRIPREAVEAYVAEQRAAA